MALKREDWFLAALPVLKTKGIDGVTIETLCKSLNRTKGSFYHHFKDHSAFLLALLDWWYDNYTVKIIEEVQKENSPSAKMKKLFEYGHKIDLQVEVAIRGWAHFDERAAYVMKQVDKTRQSFQEDIYKEFIIDKPLAEDLAAIDYAAFIGFLLMDFNLLKSDTRTYKCYSDILQEAILALVEQKKLLKPEFDIEDLRNTFKM